MSNKKMNRLSRQVPTTPVERRQVSSYVTKVHGEEVLVRVFEPSHRDYAKERAQEFLDQLKGLAFDFADAEIIEGEHLLLDEKEGEEDGLT